MPTLVTLGDAPAVLPDTTPIPAANPNPSQPLADVPISPYSDPATVCSDQIVEVRGFPSSPFRITPFLNDFKNPPVAQKAFATQCSADAGGACVDTYEK
jgi:hypothetical protein